MPVSPFAVKIDGLRELRAKIKALDIETNKALTKDMRALAKVVAADAKSTVPVRSGTAANSVRASTVGGGAAVRGGKKSVPYYGWLDFGGHLKAVGKRHNSQYREKLKSGRYIYPAVERNAGKIRAVGLAAIEQAKRRVGLR